MPKGLEDFIQNQIAIHGPMNLGDFMGCALGHPESGYYMKQDPFGVDGDFTTAPEISQVFGELLGAWVVNVWQQMGGPDNFTLLECGPGRGTLMADILRVAGKHVGFLQSCSVCFLETSPVLRAMQKAALADSAVRCDWVAGLSEVSTAQPLIVIGNELLDALPIRQLEKGESSWKERVVGMVGQGLGVITQPAPSDLIMHIPKDLPPATKGDVFEIAPVREAFLKDLLALMKGAGGAALFLDYGHARSGFGDTLQAVYKHGYVGILDHIGDADLSAHVDFGVLMGLLAQSEVRFKALTSQGHFLQRLGGDIRAGYLKERAQTPEQAVDIQSGYERLIAADQMGRLFKVMGFVKGYDFELPGF